jgi:ring-1,2-phenylacetyl-CoA epoxidase subunit PaaE
MGFFNKLFGKEADAPKKVEKSALLRVSAIDRLTDNAVKITFNVPESLSKSFDFVPGQYVNIHVELDGIDYVRSYSICSAPGSDLAVGVKRVPQGKVSSFLNANLKVGDELKVDFPQGNFRLNQASGNYIGFAAGSGITPIFSMIQFLNDKGNDSFKLFFGNKSKADVMFANDLQSLKQAEKINVTYNYSVEQVEGAHYGRMNQDYLQNQIKENLDVLKADGFFICGPEQMILDAINALKTFGVSEDKIHFELFTAPVLMEAKKEQVTASFEGVSKVTAILDGEEYSFDLATTGDRILDELDVMAVDAPYSCRGGVCCTCRAKILEGSASMDNNMSLTDKDMKEGYILTCQAHPTSERLILTFDE